MLTACHSAKMITVNRRRRQREEKKKPESVISYDCMCGVDRMDQLMSYYRPLRKTLKWYPNVVLQHLDVAMANAYIIYKKVGGIKEQLVFRKSVIASLATSNTDREIPHTSKSFFHRKSVDLSRLSDQHYLDYIPPTATKQKPTRKCVVYNQNRKRKESCYHCETCSSKPALCVVPCFKIFHSHCSSKQMTIEFLHIYQFIKTNRLFNSTINDCFGCFVMTILRL